MNKIIVTHGGQRQIVGPCGRILAVEGSEEGVWFSTPNYRPMRTSTVIDLLTPEPEQKQTLIMTFDVTGLRESMINSLIAEISAQAEASDDHPDVEVGSDIVIDGDLRHASDVIAVGAGL